jgi:hypothetical protein
MNSQKKGTGVFRKQSGRPSEKGEAYISLMTRPMNDRGQGRKPISPTGELMKPRAIRMTDEEWEDAKLVGMSAIREFIAKAAKKIKAAPNTEGTI